MRASDAKLAAALQEAGLDEMAGLARAGHYNEFFGPLGTPELALIAELAQAGTAPALALRQRIIHGEFDAGVEESEEWAASPDGQDAMRRLMSGR